MRAVDFLILRSRNVKQRRLWLRLQRLRAVLPHHKADAKRGAAQGAFRCNGGPAFAHHFKAGAADTLGAHAVLLEV
jgi:hypothetical protein